jgi:glutamine synthetase
MNSGYLIFAALMMAGLDGIKNQIDPGAPSDKDLYDLPPEEEKNIPKVCHSLDQALEALDGDRDFLKAGGVFSDDFIDSYIELKMGEVTKFRAATHPLEYQLYYGI